MAAPAHYIRSIHTSFTAAPHSLVAPRSASSAWTSTAQQGAYGGYTQPRRSSAAVPKSGLASGYAAGYNALGAATPVSGAGAIMNTHNTHSYTHHLQNPSSAHGHAHGHTHGQQGQGYQGQTTQHDRRRTQGPHQPAQQQGGRRRSVSIRMPPTYSYSSANPSALQPSVAPQSHPQRPVSPSQLSAAAPVFTPRQALIQEATTAAAATPVRREKPAYKFDPFADDDVEADVSTTISPSASVSSADALTSAFGPYELQTIHIPAAAPRDIARYSPAPSRSPSPPSPTPSLLTLDPEPLSLSLSAPPPTPKLSAAPLPSPTPEPIFTSSDPFSLAPAPNTPASSPTSPSGTPTLVSRPRDDYLARIVAGLLLQRQMSGRPRRRAVYAPGCGAGGVGGMYRKSRLSAGWVGGAGVGEA